MHRTQRIDPGSEQERIDGDQGLGNLVAFRLPLSVSWVVLRQGAGGWQNARIPLLRGLQHVPQSLGQFSTVGIQGISQYRQLGRGGIEQLSLQEWKLRAVHR